MLRNTITFLFRISSMIDQPKGCGPKVSWRLLLICWVHVRFLRSEPLELREAGHVPFRVGRGI